MPVTSPTDSATHAARRAAPRPRRWWGVLALLCCMAVFNTAAAPFHEGFLTQPAGLPPVSGPGTSVFTMQLGGVPFVVTSSAPALSWEPGALDINAPTGNIFIRRADGRPFTVGTIVVGSYTPSGQPAQIRLSRSGALVVPIQPFTIDATSVHSFPDLEVDELRFAAPSLMGLSIRQIIGNSDVAPKLPTVTSISPASGTTTGGTPVIITGTNFVDVIGVEIGQAASLYTLVSSTEIHLQTPPSVPGAADVRVITAAGSSSASGPPVSYTYVGVPTITNVSPAAGPLAGGNMVTLTGTNLGSVNTVQFGGTDSNQIYLVSDTQLRAIAPPDSAGTVNIQVGSVAGTSAPSAASSYNYVAAPVASNDHLGNWAVYNHGQNPQLSTNLGPKVGNVATSYAVVSPTALGGTVTVDSNGMLVYITPLGVRSQTDSIQYTASNEGGTSNVGTLTVGIRTPFFVAELSGPAQRGTPLQGVNVAVSNGRAPYTCAVTPASGALPAGVQIGADCTLTGTPTQSGTFPFAVSITDSSDTPFTMNSATLNLVVAPPPASLTSLLPASGPASGGSNVMLTGQLADATAVMFGNQPATSFTQLDPTRIIAVTPAGTAGEVDVTVVTGNGTTPVTPAGRYTRIAQPLITQLLPAAGPAAGGTTVTVSGTGLASVYEVTVGGRPATAVVAHSDATVTFIAPAGPVGTHDVQLIGNGGASAINAASLYTQAIAPVAADVLVPSVPYNDGSNTPLVFSLAAQASNTPIGFKTGAATTALGGSVSVDTNGEVTYIAPVGVRASIDSFQFTARNAGGTSNPATVSLALGEPTLQAVLVGSGQHGTAVAGARITLSGGRAPYQCASAPSAGALPAGVQLNADCTLSGMPTQSGTFSFAAEVTDSSTSAYTTRTGTLVFTVGAKVPDAPLIGTVTTGAPGTVEVRFTAPATDGGSPIIGYTVTAQPGGASVSGTTAPLTVTGLTVGTAYTFTVIARNAAGNSVPSAPSSAVTPHAPPSVRPVNAEVGYGATAAPITLAIEGAASTVEIVEAPSHGSAVVDGLAVFYTPATGHAGEDSFSYRVRDAFSTSAAARVSITVAAPQVRLATTTLGQATTELDFSQALRSEGGLAPYRYAVTAGALPTGVTLAEDGRFTGRPTADGSFAFTVTVTDSSTGSGPFKVSQAYALQVAAPQVALDITPLADAVGAAAYTQRLSASGGTTPYRFALRTGRLPAGLTLLDSGEISGEPTEAGDFNFTVEVTDANGYTGTAAHALSVQAAEQRIGQMVVNPEAPVYTPGGVFSVAAPGGASGQPVQFRSATPAICTVQGASVLMLGAGTCVLTADQSGNSLYAAAAQSRLEVAIGAARPVLTWAAALSKVYGEDDFELPLPQSTSPAGFSFISSNPAVATLTGRTVTLHGEGSTLITATQAASGPYAAASVQVQLVVAGRPDPTRDAQLSNSLQAQVDASVRFAQAQQANIRGRLRQVRSGDNASSMDVSLAYAGSTPGQGLSLPLNSAAFDAPALPQGWGTWAAGTLSYGSSGHGRTSTDFSTGGITVGADRALGANLLLGVAGSWGRQDTGFAGSPSRTDAEQRSLAVYGLWRTGEHLFVDAVLASGRLDFTLDRWSEQAAATAHSTRAGRQLFGALTFGYEHHAGNGTTLTTYGRVDGHKAELDPYREHGLGVYDLRYGRQEVRTSALALGLEGSHPFQRDRVGWRPYWSVEYRTALDDRSDVSLNYAQRPDSRDYLLAMRSYNDDTLSLGAGIDLQLDTGWMFSLLLGHDQGRNTLRSSSVGLQVRFGGNAGPR
ncbi:IPT/TIG domain-containing protein [Stenotrophomonas sp. C3(2023)]|uniref:IPT/TIG domain-containing protein n=1 Tax=Stenotrophomonas sp. C3(2023) TaxID=3080277 RepID=UPI00293CBEDB|nr:IPT/TIG domain-containing protein [Stenotrophomonas sp. C3(2023)]MDV3467177.1 IPT/TIG domain-containing protein [Stenotrophomonas sp. C3(2023)]